MNATDILTYGHHDVLKAIDGISAAEWELEGACGVWSMKYIIAHLTSYERLLEDILAAFLGDGPGPYLEKFAVPGFNDAEVAARRALSPHEIVAEYMASHERCMALLAHISEQKRRETGTMPWYGDAYALDDLIVYMYYGHKREHNAQIAAFRDRLKVKLATASAAGPLTGS